MNKTLGILSAVALLGIGVVLGNTLINLDFSANDFSHYLEAPAPKGADKTVVATFNGSNIYKWEAEDVISRLMASQNLKNKPYDSLQEEEKMAVAREIATKKLLQKSIKDSGIINEKDVQANLRNIVDEVIQREFLARKVTVTPDMVKGHYDQVVKEIEGKDEFRLRHILVGSEEEATQIYGQLLSNPSGFADIAKAKSKDPSSANGGDTGYAMETSFVPEIRDSAKALQKGWFSKPIKTQLGWNIIKLEDRRKVNIAPFETIKDNVQQELIQQMIQAYLSSLLDGVKVELAGK